MRRVINFMRKDFTLAVRDQIMLYMLIAPILLSLIFGLFINSLEKTQMAFVVDSAMDERVVQGLEQYGKVTVVESPGAVETRVLQIDDAIGIIKSADKYNVVLEGNELESLRELAGMALDQTVSGKYFAHYTVVSLGRQESQVKNVVVIVMILMGTLMGGLLSAFNIIDEKENRAIRALGIIPLSFGEVVAARGLMATLVGIILGLSSALIMEGPDIHYGLIVLGIIFSVGLSLMISFGIGGFANSQIEGIAIIKVVFLFFTAVPVVALFMPTKWIWVLYPFPNYWAFEVFQAIFAQPVNYGDFWFASGILVVLSGMLILALMPFLKKRLFLR